MKLPLLFALGILISVSIVSCAVAATGGASSSSLLSGPSNTVGTQAPGRIGPVIYWLLSNGPTEKHVLDSTTDTITIGTRQMLFIQFKGKVAGNEKTQKGSLLIFDYENDTVTNGVLITPTRWGTLTTNPPLRWSSPGTHTIDLYVWSPDGTYVGRSITINVG